MNKPDYAPLLTPGIHRLTLAEFRAITVDPFPSDSKRSQLYSLLEQWVTKLRHLKVGAILWLNGSFVTDKFAPADIDCVMWSPYFIENVADDEKAQVKALVARSAAKALYGLDLYMELPLPSELVHRQAYWRGLFGFQHNGVGTKGFAEVTL